MADANDTYKPPESDLETDNPEIIRYRKLVKEQHPLIGGVAACFTSFLTLLALSFASGVVPGFVFVLPGLVAGLVLKFVGRVFTDLPRVIAALFVAAVVGIEFYLREALWLSIFLSFLNFVICFAVSRRLLTHEEEKVLYRHKLKRV